MISFPNAKINLGLDVTDKRSDGYHNISSCFYPISLSDILEINESDRFDFQLSGLPVTGEIKNNLVVKAYHLLRKDFGLPEVSIHLHKNIPLEAGLGGGSADGAFALKMLNELFDLFLDDSVLADYAAILGSDCPFFIYNEPMYVRGRGEVLESMQLDLSGHYLCIIKPAQSMSTKEAYQLVQPALPAYDLPALLTTKPVVSWKDHLTNDFEKTAFVKYPEFANIKGLLYDMGALFASMTGSGSAIYGLFKEMPILDKETVEGYYTWVGDL